MTNDQSLVTCHCLLVGLWLLACGLAAVQAQSAKSLNPQSAIRNPQSPESAPDLTPYLDQPIARIEVFYAGGALTGEDRALADLIGINPGDPLRLPAVHRAIARLYESGRASNVVVTARASPTSMTLRFDITPSPRVSQVVFQGVEDQVGRELRRRLTLLDPGARITPGRLNRSAEEVVEYYHSLGYFDVEAIPDTSLEDGGRRATVIFRINPGQQATVSEVGFDGGLKLPPSEALDTFRLRSGAPYNAFRLQEDMERLRQLHIERGYLALRLGAPLVRRDPERNTVAITIPVDSGPLVEMKVEGLDLSKDRMKKLFPTLQVGGVDPVRLERGRLNLLNDLQRRGYFFADVSFETLRPSAERLVIVYQVETGRKYNLKEIRLEGTDVIASKDLKSKLGSRLGSLLSRGLTSQELIEADQRIILDALRAQGYLDARVVESRSAVALNREDLIIIHVVDAGPQSHIADIVFEGNRAFPDQELLKETRLTENRPVSQPQVSEAAARLSAFYNARGYAESTVDVQVESIPGNSANARVIFKISEGSVLSIHRILIRGHQRTRESAIKNYLTFHEGDLLTTARLAQSEQELYSTSGFRRVVIDTEPAGVGPELSNRRNVVVRLTEAPRLLLTYGGGFRTDDGPRGLLEITNTNLLGRLYTGSFRVRASRREQLGQLSFTNPRPFGYKWPALLSAFIQREDRDAFDASRVTGLIQTERLLGTVFSIFRYSYSNVVISDVTEPEALRRQDSTVQIGRLSASFLLDRRDSLFEPSRGDYTSIDLSLASRFFGGAENFFRFFGEHQRYYQVPGVPSTVFAMNVRLGLVVPYGRSDSIPISERFFAGGSTTLRGFSFEEAGPRASNPDTPDRTQPLGGDALALFNAELRFPISKALGVSGAAFYDGGGVFLPFSDIRSDAFAETRRSFTHTVGFGLRIKTPVGPVRLDFGALVSREPFVPRTKFHISFGPPF